MCWSQNGGQRELLQFIGNLVIPDALCSLNLVVLCMLFIVQSTEQRSCTKNDMTSVANMRVLVIDLVFSGYSRCLIDSVITDWEKVLSPHLMEHLLALLSSSVSEAYL